ncbi:uncharacterized protein LOC133525216 [Cydia pomonella]|uniref:uncharacterized protein LOC133525216 n=1 Tax=Cydia pomonella TaxID=82600 RepID=UPI002ADDA9F5|nr:uncharacterized protein LOC133525216 [Cydia pomonella]
MSASDHPYYFTGNGTYKAIDPLVSRVGDFTPFYIAIAISSVILGLIIILNVGCCCSRYSDYWLDRHTGNRSIVSIWSTTPHLQPPLDLTELENNYLPVRYSQPYSTEYHEEHGRGDVPPSISTQPLTSSQEYLELHKRESDI